MTYLTEGICKLSIHIFYNARDLTFELQLVSVLKVKARGVDYREEQSVVLGLADLHAGGLDAFGAFG